MSRTLDTSTDPTLWALGGPRLAIEDGALVLGGGSVAAEAITQRRRRPGAGTDAPPPSDHLTEADPRLSEHAGHRTPGQLGDADDAGG